VKKIFLKNNNFRTDFTKQLYGTFWTWKPRDTNARLASCTAEIRFLSDGTFIYRATVPVSIPRPEWENEQLRARCDDEYIHSFETQPDLHGIYRVLATNRESCAWIKLLKKTKEEKATTYSDKRAMHWLKFEDRVPLPCLWQRDSMSIEAFLPGKSKWANSKLRSSGMIFKLTP
jgi:hypothetical protein